MRSVNEDNRTGFHSDIRITGQDRPVTGGNDAPLDISMPQLKDSAKKAKDILVKNVKIVQGNFYQYYIQFKSIDVEESFFRLTDFGKLFIEACIK